MSDPLVFESGVPFNVERIHAAALYCSDGRFGDQIDDLLHGHRGWPRYDRLAIPGGPACLSGQLGVFWEDRGTEKQIEFLIAVHEIKHVALIAHEGCAFYRLWLKVRPEDLYARQMADLATAARRVRRMGRLEVESYFARPTSQGVGFELVAVADADPLWPPSTGPARPG